VTGGGAAFWFSSGTSRIAAVDSEGANVRLRAVESLAWLWSCPFWHALALNPNTAIVAKIDSRFMESSL
jgi:hypothetical protein